MRVLFTNTGSWGTGSFTALDAIVKELIKLGHQAKIFFPDAGMESSDKEYYYSHPEIYRIWKFPLKNNEVELKTFPLMIPDPNPRSPNALTFKQLSKEQIQFYMDDFSAKIKQVIDDFKPDIIESTHAWIMGYLLHKLGYSYVISAQMSDQIAFKYDQSMQSRAIEAVRHAKTIFAISDYVKQQLILLYQIPNEKIVVTYNGFDEDIFYPATLQREKVLQGFKLNLPKDAKIITFAGKISKTKGIDIVLQAAQLIDKKYQAHFLIFG
jgi:glycosyltransferase involved in cell wall biosynthesis